MRKRSKYRPRSVLANPMEFVLSGMQPLPRLKEHFLMLLLRNREALEQLRTGHATRDDIQQLMDMANMSEALAFHGKGADWRDEITKCQKSLLDLASRGVDRGMRFTMKAAEWEALKFLTDLHEVQLEESTVLDIEKAYSRVEKAFQAGRVMRVQTKESAENS